MIKKKLLAFILCGITVAALFAGCGDKPSEGNSSDTSSGDSSVVSPEDAVDVDVMNFTAPEIGDQIVEMTFEGYGTVKFRLFPEYAEKGVENFVGLANDGYYDGLTFHRIIQDFMIQGGDPLGTGMGGKSLWGTSFDGGTDAHLIHLPGAVAYANSGTTASNGSQFYIVTGDKVLSDMLAYYEQGGKTFSADAKELYTQYGGTPFLDGGYTVFGQVIDGLDIVFTLQYVDTDANDKPINDVIISQVRVTEYNGEEIKWHISDYPDYVDPTAPKNVDIMNYTEPELGEDIIKMNIKDYGEVKIRLFPEYAPEGVENFIGLAQQGYYDGLTFHRVINEFMIQGGDPKGDGTGGESIWGDKFNGGADEHLIHLPGALAYANSGSTATNGSQFYIVTGDEATEEMFDYYEQYKMRFSDNAKELYIQYGGAPFLDGGYTVFGQVIDGLDVIFKVQQTETDENDKPVEDVIMESVTVESYDGSEIKWHISDYDTADTDSTDTENSGGENIKKAVE